MSGGRSRRLRLRHLCLIVAISAAVCAILRSPDWWPVAGMIAIVGLWSWLANGPTEWLAQAFERIDRRLVRFGRVRSTILRYGLACLFAVVVLSAWIASFAAILLAALFLASWLLR